MAPAQIGFSEPPIPCLRQGPKGKGATAVVALTDCDARLVSEVPWLSPDGDFRCFYRETKAAYPGRNKDPDKVNPRSRDAHRLLWSKAPLGGGVSRAIGVEVVRLAQGGIDRRRLDLGSDNFASIHYNALRTFAEALDGVTDGHCASSALSGATSSSPISSRSNDPPPSIGLRVPGRSTGRVAWKDRSRTDSISPLGHPGVLRRNRASRREPHRRRARGVPVMVRTGREGRRRLQGIRRFLLPHPPCWTKTVG